MISAVPDTHARFPRDHHEGPVPELDHVGVVVPARNEAAFLARCLEAVDAAARAVSAPTTVVVVLDCCTDASADILDDVARTLDIDMIALVSRAGCAGGARADGAQRLLAQSPDPERLWLSTTDADSTVPANWLVRQLEYGRAGSDVVAGTVEVVDWRPWPATLRQSYESRYAVATRADGHGHVHGANLGIRGSCYTRVGGFGAVTHDEDVQLVDRALAAGASLTWAADLPVRTSARTISRAPHGFADHLRRLQMISIDIPAANPPAGNV
ncbi:MAG: glycosyltransferase [Jatrophihabitans sp.]